MEDSSSGNQLVKVPKKRGRPRKKLPKPNRIQPKKDWASEIKNTR